MILAPSCLFRQAESNHTTFAFQIYNLTWMMRRYMSYESMRLGEIKRPLPHWCRLQISNFLSLFDRQLIAIKCC